MNRILLLLIMFLLLVNYGCKKGDNPSNASTPTLPTLVSPINNSINILLKPTLIWNRSEGATSYNLQVSLQSNFTSYVQSYFDITTASQSLTILLPNTTYYWRVNATNGKNVSGWSNPFVFTTGTDSIVQLNFEWISVEGSSFSMGSESGDPDEKPAHNVSLNSFSISKYEVTFNQYDLFCEATGRTKPNDNGWGRGNKPVTNVSWNEANDFCQWVTNQTGKTVRLPTEAEWEFAAKGGKLSNGFLYSGGDSLNEISWNFSNSVGQTHTVGAKKGNELGVFDMSGNVWEWCLDWFDENYYGVASNLNPKGPTNGSQKVIRGGSWTSFTVPQGEGEIVVNGCRVTDRSNSAPSVKSADFGFRCVVEE
ncbi:MAG: SUMF1/EgtB/PvdO family nonheme iron enzyme [Ignavibacteriaceae bacterium]|jgi:formylglycine-generating enzyme required for sulfatase activity|nr:SUMF1/EgtB/PvdO family nonheme iron enzyme [Ignavibacteriaceae bacterium]